MEAGYRCRMTGQRSVVTGLACELWPNKSLSRATDIHQEPRGSRRSRPRALKQADARAADARPPTHSKRQASRAVQLAVALTSAWACGGGDLACKGGRGHGASHCAWASAGRGWLGRVRARAAGPAGTPPRHARTARRRTFLQASQAGRHGRRSSQTR